MNKKGNWSHIQKMKGHKSGLETRIDEQLKAQGIDLRFVLQSPNGKIYKGSKTTYAQWCEKNGFKWAKKEIPQEWIDEKPTQNFFDYSK